MSIQPLFSNDKRIETHMSLIRIFFQRRINEEIEDIMASNCKQKLLSVYKLRNLITHRFIPSTCIRYCSFEMKFSFKYHCSRIAFLISNVEHRHRRCERSFFVSLHFIIRSKYEFRSFIRNMNFDHAEWTNKKMKRNEKTNINTLCHRHCRCECVDHTSYFERMRKWSETRRLH